jgi:hypothetical protein
MATTSKTNRHNSSNLIMVRLKDKVNMPLDKRNIRPHRHMAKRRQATRCSSSPWSRLPSRTSNFSNSRISGKISKRPTTITSSNNNNYNSNTSSSLCRHILRTTPRRRLNTKRCNTSTRRLCSNLPLGICKTRGSRISSNNTGHRILVISLPTSNRNRNINLSLHINRRLLTSMPIPICLPNPT